MASVGIVPSHSSDERIEKGNDEHKAIEQEGIPHSTEKKVIDEEEKAKAEEFVSVKLPAESEQEVANTQTVPLVLSNAKEVDKVDEAPHSDVSVTDHLQVGVCSDPKPDISSVAGSVVEAVEKETDQDSLKIPDVTESSVEAVEKPEEHFEEYSARDSESEVGKRSDEIYLGEPKMAEKPELVVEATKKQGHSEQFESQMLQPKETVDTDQTIDEGTAADESLNEEVIVLEPKRLAQTESVLEVVVEHKEAGEADEKSATLKPKENIDNGEGEDGKNQANLLKEEFPAVQPRTLENSEPVDGMRGKAQELVEEVEKKSEIFEPKESVDSDVTKYEATPIDMVKKYNEPLKEEEVTKDQIVASESDTVACAGQETESTPKEDEVRSVTPDIVENAFVGDSEKEVGVEEEKAVVPVGGCEANKEEKVVSMEESKDKDIKIEELTQHEQTETNAFVGDSEKEVGVEEEKAVVPVGGCEANKEEKVVSMEESKDKDIKIEELTQPEQTETVEDKEAVDMKIDLSEENNNVRKEELMLPGPIETKGVDGSFAATEVDEKSSEEQGAYRDPEMFTEEKKGQGARADTPDLNGKLDAVDTSIVNEPTEDSKESVLEGKVEEAIRSCTDNVDRSDEVAEETAKSVAPNVEVSKIENNSKADQDPPRQEVSVKPSQKQSNNIIAKVKQSIVKVKKAIIGKSPSSKTLSSEAKGDIQVK